MTEVCHYCLFVPAQTKDHIVPRARGGCDKEWNLVPACLRCNERKRDRMPTCACARCLWALHRWERGDRAPTRADKRLLRRIRIQARQERREAR